MRILILGGTGFIGSALAKRLSGSHDVETVGRDVHDVVADPAGIGQRIRDADIVIHLLGGGGTKHFLTVESALGDSLRVTEAIASMCAAHRKPIVFASTIAVYTSYAPRPIPFSESLAPIPDEVYGTVKLLSEHIVQASGAPYLIFRFSNVYGMSTNFSSSGVLGLFIRRACAGEPLTVMGGSNLMDYVHLDDLTHAVDLAIEKGAWNETINIGTGKGVSVKELAALVKDAVGDAVVDVQPASGRQFADRVLDVSKAKRLLGWTPKVALKDGVQRTVEAYRKAL